MAGITITDSSRAIKSDPIKKGESKPKPPMVKTSAANLEQSREYEMLQKHVTHGGQTCPFCGSIHMEHHIDCPHSSTPTIYRVAYCHTCRKGWTEELTLTTAMPWSKDHKPDFKFRGAVIDPKSK